MRTRLFFATAIVAALASVPSISGGAMSPHATGSARTIALYREVVRNTNSQRVERESYVHYYWLADNYWKKGLHATFEIAAGVPRPSRAFVEVTATVVYRQEHSHPVWELWTFAASCGSARPCRSKVTPVVFFVTKSRDFWGFKPGKRVACWFHATGKSEWIRKDWTTNPPWQVYGHFEPEVVGRKEIFVTSTYPAGDGGTAKETDAILKWRHLFAGSQVHDSATTYPAYPAYSFSIKVVYPTRIPEKPTIRLCS